MRTIKRVDMIISLFLALTLGPMSSAAIAQIPTEEEKQQIIAGLDSLDNQTVTSSLYSILQFKMNEAIPALERNLWRQQSSLRYRFLQALTLLSAPNAPALATSFVDSLDHVSRNEIGVVDPLFYKARTALLLFEMNDNSKIDYVFAFLEAHKTHVDLTMLPIVESLEKIATRIPAFADSVLTILQNCARYGKSGEIRLNAMRQLSRLEGSLVFDTIADRAINDSVDVVRFNALMLLINHNYPNLQDLLKDRLVGEPAEAYRFFIAESLLTRFGSPVNFKFVRDYQMGEPDQTTKQLIGYSIAGFKPKVPNEGTSILELLDSLIAVSKQVYETGWLTDANFSFEVNNDIQNSRSFLLSGDSAACAWSIRSFQSKVDSEYRDSLDNDGRAVTIEGWKFLYYNAQYILDRLPKLTSLSQYSLFATHSLWLEQNSTVFSGDIGVNEAGTAPFLDSQVELSVGIGTSTAAGYTVKVNRIKVKQGSTVGSDVYYNELENNGTITGTQHTPLTLPLISGLPQFKPASPGSQNITIPQNGTETLQAGSYGDILVRKNGKLTFTGGTYHLASINTGDNVQLLFQAPSEVRIAGKFDTDQGTYIGPHDTASLSASQIVFYIGGINGNNGNLGATPKATQIGLSNTVKANFYVPNGTLWIRQGTQATGAFVGKDVDVGIGVKIWLKSAF